MDEPIDEPDERTEKLAAVFKALSEPVRLRLLEKLSEDSPQSRIGVCELADTLRIPQPNVSHHLAILKAAGLVRCSKESCKCYYSVNAAALDAAFTTMREKV